MLYVVVAIALCAVFFLIVRSKGGGGSGLPPFPPGTRAFEAFLTLDPLVKTIASRKAQLAAATDAARKDRLTREIAFLEKQVPELQAIVAARDTSPGRGYIGFDNLPADPEDAV
jgi:hypothetical protein